MRTDWCNWPFLFSQTVIDTIFAVFFFFEKKNLCFSFHFYYVLSRETISSINLPLNYVMQSNKSYTPNPVPAWRQAARRKKAARFFIFHPFDVVTCRTPTQPSPPPLPPTQQKFLPQSLAATILPFFRFFFVRLFPKNFDCTELHTHTQIVCVYVCEYSIAWSKFVSRQNLYLTFMPKNFLYSKRWRFKNYTAVTQHKTAERTSKFRVSECAWAVGSVARRGHSPENKLQWKITLTIWSLLTCHCHWR